MNTASTGVWDSEVDLLVAGAGAGGMAAALVGSVEGLEVLVCEKSGQAGGTASTSAGTLWIPGNHQSTAAGYDDTAERGKAYLEALIGDERNAHLRDAYLKTGPEAIDYYVAKTDVQFNVCGTHPDYLSSMPGAAVTGRALVPQMFDGRLLGADFRHVRPPIREFMVFGGMMVGKDDIPRLLGRFKSAGNFWYSAKLFLRYISDRLKHQRGTRLVMGNALVARLFYSLRKRQVPVWFDTPIKEIIREDGRVAGAAVDHNGTIVRVKARRGVVLATGGFAHNKEMRRAFMMSPAPEHSLAAAGNDGDGIMLGRQLGGDIAPDLHRGGGFWTPVSVVPHPDGTKGLFPHLSLDRAKPGLMAVNSAGQRFVDEGASYHHFVEAMYESHKTVPTLPAYLICDKRFIAQYGLGCIYPGTRDLGRFIKSGYLVYAETIQELAGKLKIDPAALLHTKERHDEFARTGKDLDFHKGESALSRFNGDPAQGPNPCLRPIEGPGFCALAVWPAELGCSTGLSTNADAVVLDAAGHAIPGLYACGNDMGSVMRGTYPGPGTTLGPALVFGYRAAMHAAHGGGTVNEASKDSN